MADPVLRGETMITVRLMSDVEFAGHTDFGSGWHYFGESLSR